MKKDKYERFLEGDKDAISKGDTSEGVFRMILASLGHVIGWPLTIVVILWIARPEMGAEWILHRSMVAGLIIAGVILIPLWLLFICSLLDLGWSNWKHKRMKKILDELE